MPPSLSICIPRVDRFASKRKIGDILEKYNLGSIDRIDIVGRDLHRRAFIHFNSWNTDVPRVKDIFDRLQNSENVKIIYAFPWYWRCVKSRIEKTSSFNKY